MSNNALQTIINARLPGKEGLWQIHLQDGKISAIDAQSGVMPITENSLDAEQGLVIPPFVEPHIHLDTTQTAGQPNWNQSGTLFEGIERWAERKALLTHDDVKQRAWQTLKWQIANGIQHVRTHVDVSDATLTALKAMLEVKQEVAPWIDLQIVAFPQEGILSYPNGEALLEEALRLGADVVGRFRILNLPVNTAWSRCIKPSPWRKNTTVSSTFTVMRSMTSSRALSKPLLPWRTVKAWVRESPPATPRQCTPITGRIPHACSAC